MPSRPYNQDEHEERVRSPHEHMTITREDPDDRLPVRLDRAERRALYGLLQGDVIPRLRRIEYGGIALTVAVASPKLGGPSVSDVLSAVVSVFG